jgi:uracil-DNA glycosylase family 4
MAEISSALLSECSACPRLVALRQEVREARPDYHAAPVPAWGRRDARLLIVGLAPGMHGANRTGRPFTGDASGSFLFAALHRAGLATAPQADQARLRNTRITNAVRCLPPANRPTAAELHQCRPYLQAEIETLRGRAPRRPRCILCLGRVAHDAVVAALDIELPDFAHGRVNRLGRQLHLIDTYHPSRQNTNTGRLTSEMLDSVLCRVVNTLNG